MRNAYLIDCVRTPRGRMSRPKKNIVGEFHNVHPALLGSILVDALLDRNPNVPPEKVEDVIYSVVAQIYEQGANMGRTVVMASKLPPSSSGITINRACSGAMQSNAFANASVRIGDYDIVMAGGGEHMNKCNLIGGAIDYERMPWPAEVFDKYNLVTQGQAAEMVCEKYNLTQQEIDEFSVRSQKLAHAATEAGKFKNEMVPVPYVDPDGNNQVLDRDSNIKPDTTVEKITALSRPFKENGLIHAAASSGIVDGASMAIWAAEEMCEKYDLKPRARILSSVNYGVLPDIMLDGVIPGTKIALERAGLSASDIDLFEINEAFASVPVAWMKECDIPLEKVNVNGGAIALGHPLGATGGMLLATLVNELERQDKKYGLITMCAAYGQSGTMIIERM